MICDSRPSEIATLESMTVEDYYSTVNTWLRIIDEKNKAAEDRIEGREKNVKQSRSAKRTSSAS